MNTCAATDADPTDPPRMWLIHQPEDWDTNMSMIVGDDDDGLYPQRRYPIKVCSRCHCLYVEYAADDPKEQL